MKIKINIMYEEGYLPTERCRKLRYRDKKETVLTEIKEMALADMELIFHVKNNSWEPDTDVYAVKGSPVLWAKVRKRGESKDVTVENLITGLEKTSYYYARRNYKTGRMETRDEVIKRLTEDSEKKLLVDGKLYEQVEEPMYCIYTFGLGHNHGGIGTSLSIVWHYNCNISHRAYFSALELEKAREEAIKTAVMRGDTDSLEYIRNCNTITVYHPEYVTRNPAKNHGDGEEFLNQLKEMVAASDSPCEAALLAMTSVARKIKN